MRQTLILLSIAVSTLAQADLGLADFNLSSITWIYAGAEGGYSEVDPQVTGESRKKGSSWNLNLGTKLMGTSDWDIDLNLGWYYSNLQSNNRTIRTEINGPYFNLSPVYRLTVRWHLGIAFQGFHSSNAIYSESTPKKQLTLAIGPKLFYEWPLETYRIRLGIQATTDLNIPNRRLLMGQFFFHFGFPIGGEQKENTLPTGSKIQLDETVLSFKMNAEVLDFEYEGTELSERSRKLLRKIAETLKESPWRRTTLSYRAPDFKTSKGRADSILKALVFFGLSTETVSIATAEDGAKDGECELRIIGAEHYPRLKKELELLIINNAKQ